MKLPIEVVEEIRRLYTDELLTLAEVGQKIGISKRSVHRVMQAHDIPRRSCAKRNQSGPANPRWKGPSAGYNALHQRVEAARGKPKRCDRCGLGDPKARYEWANLTGRYDDVADFERMCVRCHRQFDNKRIRPNPVRPGRPRQVVVCRLCGETRNHSGRGLCGTCYTRCRRRGELPPVTGRAA